MTARQGCPPRPQGIMVKEWAALLMRGQIISFSFALHPFLTSLPLTNLCPEAPLQITAQYSSKKCVQGKRHVCKEEIQKPGGNKNRDIC